MKNLTLIANTISKEYRSKTVVNSVSLEVNQGEIVGLLGPNGAGKTTSFYIIVGLIQPNSGKIFLGNEKLFISGFARIFLITNLDKLLEISEFLLSCKLCFTSISSSTPR